MKNYPKEFMGLLINHKKISFLAVLLFSLGFSVQAATSDNVSGYAWSENIGWISFNNTTGGGSSFGVNINPTNGKLSGYAWSENIGWISFDEVDTDAPPSNDPCADTSCIAKATPSGQLGKGNVNINGWARALSNGSGWDGWIRFDHNQANPAYIDSAGNFLGWAWGSDVVGWINFYNVVLDLSGLNQPPDKPGIPAGYPANGVVESNCSVQALSIPTFNWTYSDPDGDPQAGYQIQLDDAVNFLTPILDETVNQVSVSYAPTSAWVSSNLSWNTSYYWRVKVKDNQGNWSLWSNSYSFTTFLHAYPWINFSWLPALPSPNELIQFSPASTTYYGGSSGLSWAWDFGDSTATSTQNPSHSYLTSGTYLAKLGVCDNSNYCCAGANSRQKSVQISLPLPVWKEISPF